MRDRTEGQITWLIRENPVIWGLAPAVDRHHLWAHTGIVSLPK